ncbi:MAG: PAS domain-containing protein [Eubacteriales bacterium]
MIRNDNEVFDAELLTTLLGATGVGFWVWDLEKNIIDFTDGFFDIVGHTLEDIIKVNETSDHSHPYALVHPEDKERLQEALANYRNQKVPSYVIEFRAIKKDGTTIWLQERGEFIKRALDGTPLQMATIVQDISVRKEVQEKLVEKQKKLELSMVCSGLADWEWDIVNDRITYSEEYAKQLGYDKLNLGFSSQERVDRLHPDDGPRMKEEIEKYLRGEIPTYDIKLRVRKADGSYLWIKDKGEVTARNSEGKPTKLIGGRLNIDELERATLQLETYHEDLEAEILLRTEALIRQDTLMMEITRASQKLMTTQKGDGYEEFVFECMDEITRVSDRSRLCIFRNKLGTERPSCYLANHRKNHKAIYRTDFTYEEVEQKFEDEDVTALTGGLFTEETRADFYEFLYQSSRSVDFSNIDYQEGLPTFLQYTQENRILNIKSVDLQPVEFFFMKLQGIKSILLSPITINNESWGFIVMDDVNERMFSLEEEKMLALAGSVFAQAIHQNETEIAAQEAVEHGKLMMDATPICSTLWLNDGTCVDCSQEATRLFDLNSQEEYMERFDELSPEFQPCGKRSDIMQKEVIAIAREMGYHRFEWLHQKLNGVQIPCEVTLVRIKYKDDFAVVGYTRDLRELNAMLAEIEENQENLRQAHEEAVLSSQAKSNFLANMSHEIRTPMNAISGMTDIILRETEKTEVSEYAHNIKRACDSLLTIINDVLDISKIESGKLDIVEGEYELSAILNDVIQIANTRLELKSLMFVTNFQHDLPDKLIGDEIRVKQVLVNLLNNAIKFTSEGHVSLDVTGEYDKDEVKLTFTVQDTGSGISEDDLERLFIEFERVNTKKNRSIEGTGLGLAISKRLCEMMNGSILVESVLGEGSVFKVTIKQKIVDYVPLAQVKKEKSVLIFEARDLYLHSIAKACAELGVTHLPCSLQSELNDALLEKSYDYIFTSSMYLSKVEEMLQKLELSQTTIVLLADTAEIKAKYDFTTIILPVNTLSIANVINGKVFATDHKDNVVNFVAPDCHVLVVDDNLVNLKVAKGLMKPYQFQISTAEDGRQAVKMISENHYDMVFMDHMMPIMDGVDATIAVRAMEGEYFQNLPIVALTANAIIGTRDIFIKQGMNDFLAKPIKIATLHEIIHKWLPDEKQIVLDQSEMDASTTVVKEITIPCVDTDLGLQRVGGDFDNYIEILNMYYKDGVKRITSILNFYSEKKINDYKIEVHALKSASASIGAIAISDQAKALEDASGKGDWVFLDQNTTEFIDDFKIVLEHIRTATKAFIVETNNDSKKTGEESFYLASLEELEDALDCVDINLCDEILAKISAFSWLEDKQEQLAQIKDFISGYEYDEGVEFIQKILNK